MKAESSKLISINWQLYCKFENSIHEGQKCKINFRKQQQTNKQECQKVRKI